MVKTASLFRQLLEQVPRNEFAKLVDRHDAEYGAKGFTCWSQFTALLFCQLAHADSLREICNGLTCCQGKLTHLGVAETPQACVCPGRRMNVWTTRSVQRWMAVRDAGAIVFFIVALTPAAKLEEFQSRVCLLHRGPSLSSTEHWFTAAVTGREQIEHFLVGQLRNIIQGYFQAVGQIAT